MAKQDEEEVACPVCGKPVGLSVPSCPYCGAEFEEEEEVEEEAPVEEEIPRGKAKGKAKAAPPPVVPAEEVQEVSCPVCGKPVGLEVASCPHCGAEFEEAEVEEVIEVEEKQVVEKEEPEEEGVAEEGEEVEAPTSIMDLRVIGVALIILGIIGSQVALMIDWYWSWVPPISQNLGLFVAIPAVVVVVGLLVFMLVKKAVSGGKTVPGMMPGVALSLFLFGIFALIIVLLYNPINEALQSSQMSVGLGFILVLAVGIGLMFMGTRTAASRATG